MTIIQELQRKFHHTPHLTLVAPTHIHMATNAHQTPIPRFPLILEETHTTKEKLARLLAYLAKHLGTPQQFDNGCNQGVTAYIFRGGYVVNVQH